MRRRERSLESEVLLRVVIRRAEEDNEAGGRYRTSGRVLGLRMDPWPDLECHRGWQ